MPTDVMSGAAFVAVEVIGVVAFALSGVMAAARARMDWLGAMVLALVVAVGGGTIRDLLLGHLPVFWLEKPWPVMVALATAVVMIVVLRLWPREDLGSLRPTLIADAAGLAAFVIVGTQAGLQADLAPPLAVLLGTLTGVGGGVIRDLLTGSKPEVLVGQVYAVAGIVGASVYCLLEGMGVNVHICVWAGVLLVFGIRILAIQRNWNLPRVLPDDASSAQDRG